MKSLIIFKAVFVVMIVFCSLMAERVADALEISIRTVQKLATIGMKTDKDYEIKIKVHAVHVSARGSSIYIIDQHAIRTRVHAMYSAESKVVKQCWTEDENLPHESKCNLYYRCVYGVKVLKSCPGRKLYNTELRNCDDSYNVACGSLETSQDEEEGRFYISDDTANNDDEWNEMSPDSESDAIVTYVDTVVSTVPSQCPLKSDPFEESAVLPHEKWCNAFYKCSNGKKYLMSCPGMLQFNPKVLGCDWPVNVRCIEQVPSTSTTEAPLMRRPPKISL